MSFFDFNGHRVWYQETGVGDPIVFLHNGGNDHQIWEHQTAHFARTHRVFVVDHLGYGNSDKPEIDYTLPLFTAEVAALVDRFSLAPVTLVGHCIGGGMALNYTLQNPTKVDRLILFNVATENTLCGGPLAGGYQAFRADRAVLDATVAALEAKGTSREEAADQLQRQYGRRQVSDDPAFAEYIFELWNRKGQMRALYNNIAQFDSFAAIDSFRRPEGFPPTMLIWGAENQILPAAGSERLREILQPDSFHLMAGCGHLTMREAAAEVNELIEAFLAPRTVTA